MIAMMLRETAALAGTDLSSVEFVRMGSAPVSASLMEATHETLPRPRSPMPMAPPKPGRWCSARIPRAAAAGDLGRLSASVVRFAWSTATNRDAEQGVLEMKCPALMNGYHNRPDVPPPFTPDGFYITGDVFRRDADGFHYFIGRTDDMFVSGGENIYPTDVERMLERHPDVGQAVVVPVDDDIKGTKPVAFIIAKAGRKPTEAIKKYALANAPAYQHPRFVWFVDDLPLASTNKVDRAALHAMAEERMANE